MGLWRSYVESLRNIFASNGRDDEPNIKSEQDKVQAEIDALRRIGKAQSASSQKSPQFYSKPKKKPIFIFDDETGEVLVEVDTAGQPTSPRGRFVELKYLTKDNIDRTIGLRNWRLDNDYIVGNGNRGDALTLRRDRVIAWLMIEY